jgi:hypothetical protein
MVKHALTRSPYALGSRARPRPNGDRARDFDATPAIPDPPWTHWSHRPALLSSRRRRPKSGYVRSWRNFSSDAVVRGKRLHATCSCGAHPVSGRRRGRWSGLPAIKQNRMRRRCWKFVWTMSPKGAPSLKRPSSCRGTRLRWRLRRLLRATLAARGRPVAVQILRRDCERGNHPAICAHVGGRT